MQLHVIEVVYYKVTMAGKLKRKPKWDIMGAFNWVFKVGKKYTEEGI